MRYRIIEDHRGFYPQERSCFLYKWAYIDISGTFTCSKSQKHWSLRPSYEAALEVIKKRKEHLQRKKFKKIHNL